MQLNFLTNNMGEIMNSNSVVKSDPNLSFFYIKLKFSPILVELFFVLVSVIMILLAVHLNVWDNITYSLKISYTTWIGEIILGIVNIFILI